MAKEAIGEIDSAMQLLLPEIFTALFALPAMVGFGQHWKLTSGEAEEIGNASYLALQTLPKAKRKAFDKWGETYIPVLLFAMVTLTAIGKRAAINFEDYKRRKETLLNEKRANYNLEKQATSQTGRETPGFQNGSVSNFLNDPFGNYTGGS